MAPAAGAPLAVVDAGRVADQPAEIARVLGNLAARCDLAVTTGGAPMGEEDHSASADAGGQGAI